MSKQKKTPGSRKKAGNQPLIDHLNRALSLEYAATIQYLQQQCVLKGQDRQDFAPFFAAQSSEAHLHAKNLGNKIVSLGGVPTIVPAKIREAGSLNEMLKHDLAMERDALNAYVSAWKAVGDNPPLKFWLEAIIRDEQLHVDELEKLTSGGS
ncbi:MAG: bacterioferritin [Blastocatellia bacterium]